MMRKTTPRVSPEDVDEDGDYKLNESTIETTQAGDAGVGEKHDYPQKHDDDNPRTPGTKSDEQLRKELKDAVLNMPQETYYDLMEEAGSDKVDTIVDYLMINNVLWEEFGINIFKESTIAESSRIDFYVLEVGVELAEDDDQYEMYYVKNLGKSLFDENVIFYLDKYKAEEYADHYVEKGVPGTYAMLWDVTDKVPDDELEDVIQNIKDHRFSDWLEDIFYQGQDLLWFKGGL